MIFQEPIWRVEIPVFLKHCQYYLHGTQLRNTVQIIYNHYDDLAGNTEKQSYFQNTASPISPETAV